jgi:hypothetical protein
MSKDYGLFKVCFKRQHSQRLLHWVAEDPQHLEVELVVKVLVFQSIRALI